MPAGLWTNGVLPPCFPTTFLPSYTTYKQDCVDHPVRQPCILVLLPRQLCYGFSNFHKLYMRKVFGYSEAWRFLHYSLLHPQSFTTGITFILSSSYYILIAKNCTLCGYPHNFSIFGRFPAFNKAFHSIKHQL